MPIFEEHLLQAHDVCSNCFGRRRREAIQPRRRKPDSTYHERLRWRTTVEYVPSGTASGGRTVFCECGAAKAGHRHWSDEQILANPDRFRELLKQVVYTLEAIACTTIDRKRLIAHALDAFKQIPDPGEHGPWREGRPLTINEALSIGVQKGVHMPPRADPQLATA